MRETIETIQKQDLTEEVQNLLISLQEIAEKLDQARKEAGAIKTAVDDQSE